MIWIHELEVDSFSLDYYSEWRWFATILTSTFFIADELQGFYFNGKNIIT